MEDSSGIKTSEGKKFLRIRADLADKIRTGVFVSGALLPRREDLAREYQTSRATMEKAVSQLIRDGLLEAVRKKGTFVRNPLAAARVALVAPPSAGNNLDQPRGDSIFLAAAEGFWKNAGNLKPRLLPWPAFAADPTGWDAAVLLYPENPELNTARHLRTGNGLKLFAINRIPEDMNYASYDNSGAARDAVLRYHRICPKGFLPVFLDLKNPSLPVTYRREGFLKACADKKIFYRLLTLDTWEDAASALEKLESKTPVAVVSASGWAGPSVAAFFRKKSLVPGKDVWYTGFDDENPLAKHGYAFSTFLQNPAELGELGAKLLAEVLAGIKVSAQELLAIPFVKGVS